MPSMRSSHGLAAALSSTCGVCGKSIQSISLKRHERYCRKKLQCPAPPRRKSCVACIRTKSRCDSCTPACGLCQLRGRSCLYSNESLPSGAGRIIPSQKQSNVEPKFTHTPAAESAGHQMVPNYSSLAASMFTTFEASTPSIGLGFSGTLSSKSSDSESAKHRAVRKVVLAKSDRPSTPDHVEVACPSYPHLLKPKKRRPANKELVSKLVSQSICSFTERRMNEDSCPPFIHWSTFQRSAKTLDFEDPLIICQNITHDFAARRTRGDLSIWNSIALEQERLYDQRHLFDKWLHLSSAQALMMYLLMLAEEGETVLSHHPNISIALLFTLGSNFEYLNQVHPGFMAAKEEGKDRPSWEDWIFAESKLRTATTYFMLVLLFNVNFGLPCDREGDYELGDVNLPAAKILWDAKTDLSWLSEFDLARRTRVDINPFHTNEATLKYGDLVRSNEQNCGREDPDIQQDETGLMDEISRWQRQMDEFGMLVALCSTIG